MNLHSLIIAHNLSIIAINLQAVMKLKPYGCDGARSKYLFSAFREGNFNPPLANRIVIIDDRLIDTAIAVCN